MQQDCSPIQFPLLNIASSRDSCNGSHFSRQKALSCLDSQSSNSCTQHRSKVSRAFHWQGLHAVHWPCTHSHPKSAYHLIPFNQCSKPFQCYCSKHGRLVLALCAWTKWLPSMSYHWCAYFMSLYFPSHWLLYSSLFSHKIFNTDVQYWLIPRRKCLSG